LEDVVAVIVHRRTQVTGNNRAGGSNTFFGELDQIHGGEMYKYCILIAPAAVTRFLESWIRFMEVM
jgi:hypothetical protein